MWQASEAVFNDITVEGFLHIKGRVEDYRGSLQLMIDACRPWPADKVNATMAMTRHPAWGPLLACRITPSRPPPGPPGRR